LRKRVSRAVARDNHDNDTLIEVFTKYYNIQAIKFQGDIPCIAYILNLVVQDILKALIKNSYNTSYTKDIYNKRKIKKIIEKKSNNK
jgi:hypothetical protein